MAAWPNTLPLPQQAQYQITPLDQVARTQMETGAPRARRRSAARLDTLSVVWVFDDAQFAIFRSFMDTEADGGAVWWQMGVDTDGTLVTKDCRLIGPWQAQKIDADYWRVSAKLEVR